MNDAQATAVTRGIGQAVGIALREQREHFDAHIQLLESRMDARIAALEAVLRELGITLPPLTAPTEGASANSTSAIN